MRHCQSVGKGWAKGLTAATDERVRRMAEAHRGMQYRLQKSPRPPQRPWTPSLAYAVGLMATDGCLYADRRHLAFTSTDLALVTALQSCLGRPSLPVPWRGGAYRYQFGDVGLYRWLEGIGLTPRKSLTLGGIEAPDDVLLDVVRGLLDGDGSILNLTYAGGGKARGKTYRTLITRFNSASRRHLEWLRRRLQDRVGIAGSLATILTKRRTFFFHLSYAKRESEILLSALYADREAPCLLRKRDKWDRFLALEASSEASPTRVSGSAR